MRRTSLRYRSFSVVSLLLLWSGGLPVMAAEPAALLVPRHAQWRYFAKPAEPPANWNQASFDDEAWKSGPTGIGYGDEDDWTVLGDMRDRYRSVYLRARFELADVDDAESLYLYLRFDDGFIAYLNGTQIAAESVTRTDRGLRAGQHEANRFEEFVIDDAARMLRPGANVIAVEGHNATLDSSDFSLDPVLSTQKFDTVEGAIPTDDYLRDLDELQRRLESQSSYLTRRGFDYETAFKELRAAINEGFRFADFVSKLRKLVMRIGDCHANVSSSAWPQPEWFLPLRPADTSAGVAALGINRNEPIDAQCPYIESIDAVPLERWMAAASKYVTSGSPQLVRRRSLRWLGNISLVRKELGLPEQATVEIGLRSADGTKRADKRLRLTKQRYAVAQVRLQQTRKLDGNIGYVRIPTMVREQALAELTVNEIKSFRDTDGLMIDVRNNGGGTYAVLRAIYGFFVPESAKPYVTNIAAYRLSDRFADNHIAYRPTYRAQWNGWNGRERQAIESAAAAFDPEWQPPPGKFSQWHYMVLSRQRSGRRHRSGRGAEDYFFYDKPVVILCNAGSFSATDGFLSAFADLPQVTILGEPSGGGSGATRDFLLPNTQVYVALSSMASFRSSGKLFDGNGVEVDILARPTLEDFTSGADSVLERGIALIRERTK